MATKDILDTSGRLLITYDYTKGADKAVVLVGYRVGMDLHVLKTFSGEEAFELLKKLTGKKYL